MMTSRRFASRRVSLLLATLLLAACAQNPPAPVTDMSHVVGAPAAPVPAAASASGGDYVVQPGDTLYAIAFRNQLDWRDLAAWNGIIAPYTIHPGTSLRLAAPAGGQVASTATSGTQAAVFEPETATPTASTATPPAAKMHTETLQVGEVVPVASSPAPEAAPAVAATTAARTVASSPDQAPNVAVNPAPAVPPSAPTSSAASAAPGATRSVDGIAWSWPADGGLVGSYVAGDPTRQGLDIAGQAGAPVRAAASGVVVYSGNGLVGYGELIIVKHSDAYLSAYGHNRKRLVHEGEKVQVGQEIAEMGSTGAPRTELHFEIRRQGKPVDPMGFLPRR